MASRTTLEVTLGERLRLERFRKRISLEDASTRTQELLPASLSMSRELLRRLESGMIPEEKVNPLHVAALAKLYGVKLRELHPPSADATRVVGVLVKASSRCIAQLAVLPAAS